VKPVQFIGRLLTPSLGTDGTDGTDGLGRRVMPNTSDTPQPKNTMEYNLKKEDKLKWKFKYTIRRNELQRAVKENEGAYCREI
jgi:hypothetical protein